MNMNTLFFHGKTVDDYRFTIAGLYNTDPNNDTIDLHLGSAICSKKDPFVKATGRKKAEGRILSRNHRGKYIIPDVMLEDEPKPIKLFIDYAKEFTTFSSNRLKETFAL